MYSKDLINNRILRIAEGAIFNILAQIIMEKNVYMCITESLYHTAEISTTLSINYIQ